MSLALNFNFRFLLKVVRFGFTILSFKILMKRRINHMVYTFELKILPSSLYQYFEWAKLKTQIEQLENPTDYIKLLDHISGNIILIFRHEFLGLSWGVTFLYCTDTVCEGFLIKWRENVDILIPMLQTNPLL